MSKQYVQKKPAVNPEVIQVAIRVAQKYPDINDGILLKKSLPAFALAMHQSGLDVSEDSLSDLIERNKGDIRRLFEEFKSHASPPQPEKDFDEIHSEIMRPYEEAKTYIEDGDVDSLDNHINHCGYSVFSKKIINDLVFHAIDENQWSSIQCLFEKHNFRFEDNMYKIVQRIYRAKQYDMFVHFYEYFKDIKNSTTQEYLSEFITHGYYALLDVPQFHATYSYVRIPTDYTFLVQTLKSYLKERKPKFNADYGSLLFSRFRKTFAAHRNQWSDINQRNILEINEINFMDFLSLADVSDPKQMAEKCLINYIFLEFNREARDRKEPKYLADLWGDYLVDIGAHISKELKKEEYKDRDFNEVRDELVNNYFMELRDHLYKLLATYVRAMTPEQVKGLAYLGVSGPNIYQQARYQLIEDYLEGSIVSKKIKGINITLPEFWDILSENPITWEEVDIVCDMLTRKFEVNLNSKEQIEDTIYRSKKGRIKRLISYLDFSEIADNEGLKYRLLFTCILKNDVESFKYVLDRLSIDKDTLGDIYDWGFILIHHLSNKLNFYRVKENDKGILDALEARAQSLGLGPNDFIFRDRNIIEVGDYFGIKRLERYINVDLHFTPTNRPLHLSLILNGKKELINKLGKIEDIVNYEYLFNKFLNDPSEGNKLFLLNSLRCVSYIDKSIMLRDYEDIKEKLLDEVRTITQWNKLEEAGIWEVIQAFEDKIKENDIQVDLTLTSLIDDFTKKLQKKDQRWKELQKDNEQVHENLFEFSPYLFEKELYPYILDCLVQEFKECLKENRRFPATGLIQPRDVTGGLSDEQLKNRSVLSDEEIIAIVCHQAYGLAEIFQDKKSFLEYIEKWGRPSSDLLLHHGEKMDIILSHRVVEFDESVGDYRYSENMIDRKAWKDAILQCGPRMFALRSYCPYLQSPERSGNGKSYSLQNTIEALSKRVFLNVDSSTETRDEIAKLCLRFGFDSEIFRRAVDVEEKRKLFHEKRYEDEETFIQHVPSIVIGGDSFDMPGAKFYKLDDGDVRGMFLGNFVDCCQSIGSHEGAQSVIRHGYVSSYGGFYVVEKEKEVIGAVWAWIDKNGVLVFDSLETLGGRVKPESWEKICTLFSEHLDSHDYVLSYVEKENKEDEEDEQDEQDIPQEEIKKQVKINAFVVGQGGDTPALRFPDHEENIDPIDTKPYDSDNRYLVWKRAHTHEKKLTL